MPVSALINLTYGERARNEKTAPQRNRAADVGKDSYNSRKAGGGYESALPARPQPPYNRQRSAPSNYMPQPPLQQQQPTPMMPPMYGMPTAVNPLIFRYPPPPLYSPPVSIPSHSFPRF